MGKKLTAKRARSKKRRKFVITKYKLDYGWAQIGRMFDPVITGSRVQQLYNDAVERGEV